MNYRGPLTGDTTLAKVQALLDLAGKGLLKEYSSAVGQFEASEKHGKTHLGKRRSDMEFLASVLQTSRGGVNKTRILYHANLSYTQLKSYLVFCCTAASWGSVKTSTEPKSISQPERRSSS